MKIDLHVHSMERSNCGKSSEEDMIKHAILYGLDAIVFTDHRRLIPQERLAELNDKYKPFKIFGGIEVSASREHIVVLGIHDEILETQDWEYKDLYQYVNEKKGFLALAHPYRYRDYIGIDIENYPVDAIEIHSVSTFASNKQKIEKLAKEHNCKLICNSDAHHIDHIGIYHNKLDYRPDNDKELIEILKQGLYTCGQITEHINMFNEKIHELQLLAKKIHSQGKDGEYFRSLTGIGPSKFNEVVAGKSFKI